MTRQGRTGQPDQPRVRAAGVLHDPRRHRVLPQRAAQAGLAVGLRRPVDGHRARQTVAVQARRPAPGADRVGPRLPVERECRRMNSGRSSGGPLPARCRWCWQAR